MWFGFTPAPWVVTATSCALVICMVIFCCNATNLMDGLDGLCGGVTAIIAGGFLFLAVHMAMNIGPSAVHGSALRIVLALALLGAVMGFVPFNFNPASIFMGDTGSMFLGFALALLILTMAEVDTRWLLASLVMFGSIIVAAYKVGMVHERPLIIDGGKTLGPGDVMTTPSTIDAGSVLEIREEENK